MPFTIDRLADIPVLLFVQNGSPVAAEAGSIVSGLIAALDVQREPVFLIVDARALTLSLDELTGAAGNAAQRPDGLLHHANVRENLVVTGDGILKLAVYGMRSKTFGGVKIRPFSTVDEALDYCRAQIAADGGRSSHRVMTG
jgi:hypothetical protein